MVDKYMGNIISAKQVSNERKFKEDTMVNSIIDSAEHDMVTFFTNPNVTTKTPQHVFSKANYQRTVRRIISIDDKVRMKVRVLKDQGEPWCWEIKYKGRKEE